MRRVLSTLSILSLVCMWGCDTPFVSTPGMIGDAGGLSPAVQEDLLNLCRKICAVPVASLRQFREEPASPMDPYARHVFEGLNPEGQRLFELEVDQASGKPCFYFSGSSSGRHNKAVGKGGVEAIGPETAFAKALPILEYLHLSVNREDYAVVLFDEERMWSIRREFTHEGFKCYKRYIDIWVMASTAEVRASMYRPVIVPKTHDVAMGRSQGFDLAKRWLEAHQYFSHIEHSMDEAKADAIEEVIAIPTDFYEPEKESSLHPTESYYCWEVPFRFKEGANWFDAVIWVNNSTGEVIGGR